MLYSISCWGKSVTENEMKHVKPSKMTTCRDMLQDKQKPAQLVGPSFHAAATILKYSRTFWCDSVATQKELTLNPSSTACRQMCIKSSHMHTIKQHHEQRCSFPLHLSVLIMYILSSWPSNNVVLRYFANIHYPTFHILRQQTSTCPP